MVIRIAEVGHDLVEGESGLVQVVLVLELHSLVGSEGAIRDTLTAMRISSSITSGVVNS